MAKKKYMYMHLIGGRPGNFEKRQIWFAHWIKLVPTLKQLKKEERESIKFRQDSLGDVQPRFAYGYCKVLLPDHT